MSDPITTSKISSGMISWSRELTTMMIFGIRISRLWPRNTLPAFGFKQATQHVLLSLALYSCDPFCSSIYFDYLPYSCVKTAERLKFELPARPHRPPPLLSEELWAQQHDSIPSVSPTLDMSMKNLGYCSILPYLLTWLSCLLSDLFPLVLSSFVTIYVSLHRRYRTLFRIAALYLTQVRKTMIQFLFDWKRNHCLCLTTVHTMHPCDTQQDDYPPWRFNSHEPLEESEYSHTCIQNGPTLPWGMW